MMDAPRETPEAFDAGTVCAEVRAAAVAYCAALHTADTEALGRLFHPAAHLYASRGGELIDWPRETFLARVAARAPGEGSADYAIREVSAIGPEAAHVALDVAAGDRRFTDYLNFLRLDGDWRVIAKIFRVAEGPQV